MLIEQDESLSATLRLKRVNQGVLYDRTLILVIVTDRAAVFPRCLHRLTVAHCAFETPASPEARSASETLVSPEVRLGPETRFQPATRLSPARSTAKAED